MSRSKETNAGQVGPVKHLQTSLSGIERKAKEDQNHKFENLYGLLNKWNLSTCVDALNRRAATGVDKMDVFIFKKNLTEEVTSLEESLRKKKYRASLVRRTYIRKPDGSNRPLGIPTVRDKLLQSLVSRVLESIYEPRFHDFRYGYRKKRGPKEAVKRLGKELNYGKYGYVVEADIKGYFQNINHKWMVRMLEETISDKAFINLITKWLKAGVMTEGTVEHPASGTPQGGVISPIVANIYLHYVLDVWFEKVFKKHTEGEAMLLAYADDFVCAFRYKKDAELFVEAMRRRFEKFGLELAESKTRLIEFSRFKQGRNGSFDFLGFTYNWRKSRKGKDIITHTTSKKKFKASVQNLKEWLKSNRNLRMRKMIDMLNGKLRGYYTYYGIIGNYKMLMKMATVVKRLLYKWLNRRSQRRSFTWVELLKKLKITYPLQKPYIERNEIQMEMAY